MSLIPGSAVRQLGFHGSLQGIDGDLSTRFLVNAPERPLSTWKNCQATWVFS